MTLIGTLHIKIFHRNLAFGFDVSVADAAGFLDSILIENADGAGQLAAFHIWSKYILCKRGS